MGKNKDQRGEYTDLQESNLNVNIPNYNDLVITIDNLIEYFRLFEIKVMDAIHRPSSTNEPRWGGTNFPRSKPSSMTANLEAISNTIDDPNTWQLGSGLEKSKMISPNRCEVENRDRPWRTVTEIDKEDESRESRPVQQIHNSRLGLHEIPQPEVIDRVAPVDYLMPMSQQVEGV